MNETEETSDRMTFNDDSSCKYFLYRTIGSSDQQLVESGFKVNDIVHLVPSLLFLLFLLYSLPRTRVKLSGAPIMFTSVHILLYVTSITQIVRCLLMFMIPSPNSDTVSRDTEKVTWSLTHGTNFCLELTSFLIFFLPLLPSNKSSHRIMYIVSGVSASLAVIISIIETHSSHPQFHVSQQTTNLKTDLYSDGEPVFILLVSLVSALAYSSLISLRVFQKSGSRRSSTFTYSIVMLGIQGTRTLGAILLAAEVEFGICLTNLTFFLLIQFLPPLVFLCVLCPYMQTTQSHSLLNQTSSFRVGVTDDDDWLEDDYDLYTATGVNHDPLGINR